MEKEHVDHAQASIDLIDHELEAYSQVIDPTLICESVWNGLQEAVRHGWHTKLEADELYFTWYESNIGKFPA